MNEQDVTFAVPAGDIHCIAEFMQCHGILNMELRHSEYYGGEYYVSDVGKETVRIFNNFDGVEYVVDEFPDYPTIIKVDSTTRIDYWISQFHELSAVVARVFN